MNRRNFFTASAGAALLSAPLARMRAADDGAVTPDYQKPVFDLHRASSTAIKIASIDLLQSGSRYFVRTRSTDGAEGVVLTKDMADFIPILQRRVIPHFVGKDARDLESLADEVYVANYKLSGQAFWCPVAYVEQSLFDLMGKAARNVSEADALNYVAGYCTANDFSARDLQMELPASQWLIGKTLDRFSPIGPYFVSADLVGNPNNLKIETHVNGEVRQSWNTNDFICNTKQMIAYISKHWTLEPGDIIFTGTPHGVILGYPKDKQVWLKAGDEIVSTIEKLGELRFRLG